MAKAKGVSKTKKKKAKKSLLKKKVITKTKRKIKSKGSKKKNKKNTVNAILARPKTKSKKMKMKKKKKKKDSSPIHLEVSKTRSISDLKSYLIKNGVSITASEDVLRSRVTKFVNKNKINLGVSTLDNVLLRELLKVAQELDVSTIALKKVLKKRVETHLSGRQY